MNLHLTQLAFLTIGKQHVSRILMKTVFFVLFFATSFNLIGQSSIERTIACSCIDNNAPSGKAQFMEEITVYSGVGETWYISSVSGFYQLDSPVPPESQIQFTTGPSGDTLVTDGDGSYILEGLHIEDLGYSITLTNGVVELSLDNILCEFPSGNIIGDNAICGAEENTYSVDNYNPNYTYAWFVSGQGTITTDNTEPTIDLLWDEDGIGEESITLVVTGPTGCSSTSVLDIEFEGNITLACNNLINIAVASTCIIDITPDDILEDMQYNDESYEIIIIDPETGEEIENGDLASDVLFDTLEVSILHICSNNLCWGQLVFEDKYVPPLECMDDTIDCHEDDSPEALGFPVPATANVSSLGNDTYNVSNFDACGDATLVFSDNVETMTCADPFASVVTRSWILTDFSGTSSSCVQTINKERTTVDDIDFPGDWDGITNPVLQCDGNFPKLVNGNPDPSFTGMPTGGICEHINITYTDLISEICGATYKVVRKWQLMDMCTNELRNENQLIKIEDNDAPDFDCPNNMDFYIEDYSGCDVTVITPFPSNIVDCSEVEFSGFIVKVDDFGNIQGTIVPMDFVNGSFRSTNRALGRHKVSYYGLDACGYDSSCDFFINVYDNVPPTAVCDLNTTIALDNTGNAIVPFTSFDNGSFDNCSVALVEVSRGSNSCGVSSGFSESITLCCADANSEVMVTLRVTDDSGNVNTCMVMVMVQDKKVPIIDCPINYSIDCTDDYSDLSIFGTATATDNCSASINEDVQYVINSCGVGTIYRNFTATDPAGNESVCTQIINVIDSDPFDSGNIIWPADYSTTDCVSPNLAPEDLPTIYSFPQLSNTPCSNSAYDYDDKVYTNVNGTCKSIFRTWTVIDQCTNDHFTFVQKLHITDNSKPLFEECSNKTLTGEAEADCLYSIEYTKNATDQCTSQEDLRWEYKIDISNNGNYDIIGYDNSFIKSLPAGTHKVNWLVKDDCNNFDNCIEYITINDTKKPTPYCLGGISTVIMPSTGSIAIWANDFDLASEDNCTEQEDLVFSFSANQSDSGKTFTCEDLEGSDDKLFTLEVYVHDEAGNYDYCTSTIRLTANNGSCDTSSTLISISGLVFTEDQEKMEAVNIALTDNTQEYSFNQLTQEDGLYAFQELDEMMNYSISPSYDDQDYLNGITTLDIVLIQKHILGISVFDTPYKVIAADVNNSESVSGVDIIQLRKLLLGYYDVLPDSENWTFVDASQEFPNDLTPWPYKDKIDLLGDKAYGNQNFISIKKGDVNLSRSMNFQEDESGIRTNESIVIEYDWTKEGDESIVTFNLKEITKLYGFQFNANTNIADQLKSVSSPISIRNEHISAAERSLTFSYSEAIAQNIEGELFKLNFGNSNPASFTLNEENMKVEAYIENLGKIEVVNIELKEKDQIEGSKHSLIVFQNVPNPFSTTTSIEFELANDDQVQLEIRNVNGKIVYKESGNFMKGRNTFKLDNSKIPTAIQNGILFYSLINSESRVTKKMIAIQ